jgi:putative DNA primase/helicase
MLKQAALAYAAKGWRVIPLHANTKEAIIGGWQHKASADSIQIDAWWTQWPNANIGILAESVGGLCIDLDRKNGDDGVAVWMKLLAEQGDITTAVVETPSTGQHWYFMLPPEAKFGNGARVVPGIDFRGKAGYVVAPPSTIDGKTYRWLNEVSPAEAPPWLLKWLSDAIASRRKAPNSNNALAVPEGSRNDTLFRRACAMRQIGLEEDEIFARVWQINVTECTPPLAEKEVRTIANSAMRYDADFRMTDLGNAQRLIELYGRDIRYIPPFKSWYVWNGKVWQRDENGEVPRYAKQTIEFFYQRAARLPQSTAATKVVGFALRSHMQSRQSAMIALATTEAEVGMMMPEDFNKDTMKLAVANGVLDLKTGELLPFVREDFITHQVNIQYNPAATCPVWMAFLDTITAGNAALKRYLQQIAGYCLTGETGEQCLFFLWGPGSNGKSTFVRVLEDLVGPYAGTALASTFAKSKFNQIHNQLASMYGKRLVTTSEVEEDQEFSEVTLKMLTGQDRVAARDLYQSWFHYVPQFKLIIAANYRPQISGYDEAMWRRVRLIPLDVVIPKEKRDKNLLAKLHAEMSGILNWALAGCRDWREHRLVVPAKVEEATHTYRQSMDTVEDWLTARCYRNGNTQAKLQDLHADYQRWSKAQGNQFPYKMRRFIELMEGKGFVKKRGTGGYTYLLGVNLMPGKPEEADDPLPF